MNARLFIAALAVAGQVLAHDIWLDAETLRPIPGQRFAIYVRGGHYFPRSEFALSDRMVGELVAETSGESVSLSSVIEGKERVATHVAPTGVPVRIALVVRRPPAKEPVAWATLFIVPREAASDPGLYPRRSGLEIVPLRPVEEAKKNTTMPLTVLRDGSPVRAKIQILAAEGGTSWLEAGPEGAAAFTPRREGRHLAIVNDSGLTATLLFDVAP